MNRRTIRTIHLIPLTFLLSLLLINPLRETAMEDDWAYALTVRHVLASGEYRLHDWLVANMPFQAYWGALFASLGGYSFAMLRLSTLVLAAIGLFAFYRLAREHELAEPQAGVLTLALFASPLVLRFSFNFMTDVPFLAGLLLSLWLYTHALRRGDIAAMLLASLAATATLLIRQFGVALLAGLFVVWLLQRQRVRQLPCFVAGVALPTLAMLWQLAMGLFAPNTGATFYKHAQMNYLADVPLVLVNLFLRPAMFLEYLALFALPLVLLALVAAVHDFTQRRKDAKVGAGRDCSQGEVCQRQTSPLHVPTDSPREKGRQREDAPQTVSALMHLLPALLVLSILLALFFRGWLYQRWLMPYLYWNFTALLAWSIPARVCISLLSSVGAVLFARIIIVRYVQPGYAPAPTVPARHPRHWLLDAVTLFLLLPQLLLFQTGDEYLLPLLPFVLLVVGRHLSGWLQRLHKPFVVLCLILWLVSTLWTRGLLAYAEARWQAAEAVRQQGVAVEHIYGAWTWIVYHSFPDYLEAFQHPDIPLQAYGDYMFTHWLPQRRAQAHYLVLPADAPPTGAEWVRLWEQPYRDGLFRQRAVVVWRKQDLPPAVRWHTSPARESGENGSANRQKRP